MKQTSQERFWTKVKIGNPDECWNWIAGRNTRIPRDRGVFRFRHKNAYAHRVAWILTNGELPEGIWVLHSCDNGLCCNPAHLFLGTQADNTEDMVRKGRSFHARGELQGGHILTANQVKKIREKYIPYKYSQYRLAREYGVSRNAIEDIVLRRNWKHIA